MLEARALDLRLAGGRREPGRLRARQRRPAEEHERDPRPQRELSRARGRDAARAPRHDDDAPRIEPVRHRRRVRGAEGERDAPGRPEPRFARTRLGELGDDRLCRGVQRPRGGDVEHAAPDLGPLVRRRLREPCEPPLERVPRRRARRVSERAVAPRHGHEERTGAIRAPRPALAQARAHGPGEPQRPLEPLLGGLRPAPARRRVVGSQEDEDPDRAAHVIAGTDDTNRTPRSREAARQGLREAGRVRRDEDRAGRKR